MAMLVHSDDEGRIKLPADLANRNFALYRDLSHKIYLIPLPQPENDTISTQEAPMPKPDKPGRPDKPGKPPKPEKPEKPDVPKVDDDDRQPVTDPERSHRLALKTAAGPMLTKAMSAEEAHNLDRTIEQHVRSMEPVITIGLPDGDWRLNCHHVTAWQVIPNMFEKLT